MATPPPDRPMAVHVGSTAPVTTSVPTVLLSGKDRGTDPTLAEIVQWLVDTLHPQRVYLFGSRARGDYREDSDYDVLVIVDTTRDRLYHLATEAYGAMWGVGAPVDILVMTPGYFDSRLKVLASLPAAVHREGQLLYAA